MTPAETIVVTGIPRSGTTCMMRMLEAGGIPLYFDEEKPVEFIEQGTQFINYNRILRETPHLSQLNGGDAKFLEDCRGKAVKILTPAKVKIPKGPSYRFIWMSRKPKHCVKSNRKFMMRNVRHSENPHLSRMEDKARFADTEVLTEYVKDQTERGLKMLRRYPDSKLIVIKFEDMLKKPRWVAGRIQRFLWRPMNIGAMAKIVVKRPAHCLPQMLEEQIYA